MSNENPLMAATRQLEFDIEELKIDAGVVQSEELRIHIREMIFEKRRLILALWSEFGPIAGSEE